MTTTDPLAERRAHWDLDPEVHHLNHGSFGACPRPVLEAQTALRRELEREPVRFMARELGGRMDQVKDVLGRFLHAEPEDLAAVPNATTGVNAVLRSLRFEPGDELLVTNHGYNACRNTVEFVAERWGAHVVVAEVPFPIESPDQVLEAVLARTGAHTKLALLDHISSPTGLVFPIDELVRELQERGVPVLVDGAHAPGMVPLDLEQLGADYYTGNCHKWLCTPKGSAFLWVRRDRQAGLRPSVISHGANAPLSDKSRFTVEFDWTGTWDPTPFLVIPVAIEFLGSLFEDGWSGLREHNRGLALEARWALLDALGTASPAPESMLGNLATVILPGEPRPGGSAWDVDPLQSWLYEEHRIEVPVWNWPDPPLHLLRVSCQAYNGIDEYRALATALSEHAARR